MSSSLLTTDEQNPLPVLTKQAVASFVAHGFFLLDVHAAAADVQALLSSEDLEMVFPEATLKGLDAFNDWYNGVARIFFDEVHDLQTVDVTLSADGRSAEVKLVVRWLARRWKAPAPKSEWLGFNAVQRWIVTPSAAGRPVISRYVVESLNPIEGSAKL
jgi:hypothetical protein